MNVIYRAVRRTLPALLPVVFVAPAHGDVTMEQTMQVEGTGLMQMINMTGHTVTTISGNRSRSDSNVQMESRLMRMFGGSGSMADIVLLDQGTTYHLDLDKRTYTEMSLEEQKAAMQKSMEQMRNAQQSQQQGQSGIDESACQWSEPTATVAQSGETKTIAGLLAERTTVTASQSCADPKTGRVCSFNLVLDQWLTDDFAGGDEVLDHYRAYAGKLGLDVADSPAFAQRMESMFASYQGIWQELSAKMNDLDGYPVSSTVSLAVGGPQCESAGEAQTAGQNGPGVGEAVGEALGGALGGLFGRRRDAAQKASAETAKASAETAKASAETAPPPSTTTLPDGTTKLMSISTELVSLHQDEVDPAVFQVPGDFRRTGN